MIQNLVHGTKVVNLHLKLIRIQTSEKNGRLSHRILLSDGFENILVSYFGVNVFGKFQIGSVVCLNGFLVRNSKIDEFWIRLNKNNYNLDYNAACKVEVSKETIEDHQTFFNFDSIDFQNFNEKMLITTKGLISQINTNQIKNEKSKIMFKLIDINNKKSIDCVIYDLKEQLKESSIYIFKNVILSKPDGLLISKSWATEFHFVKKHDNIINLNEIDDLSKSNLNPIKYEAWGDLLLDETSQIASIKCNF